MDGRTELPLLPDGCSLDASGGATRLKRWQALTAGALVERHRKPGELRLRFRSGDGIRAELTALAEAERSCCSFLSWIVQECADGVELVVAGRPADVDQVAAL